MRRERRTNFQGYIQHTYHNIRIKFSQQQHVISSEATLCSGYVCSCNLIPQKGKQTISQISFFKTALGLMLQINCSHLFVQKLWYDLFITCNCGISHYVITKDIKIVVQMICQIRDLNIPKPKTGATHYRAQLGLPDKGCAIKDLVVCVAECPASHTQYGKSVLWQFPVVGACLTYLNIKQNIVGL